MGDLRRAELVRSRRGCDGGYWLGRPADAITVADVVRAVEGEVLSLHTGSYDDHLWRRLGDTVTDLLEGWTVDTIEAARATAGAR